MEAFARKLGLVGEGASLRGAYLTASSRFNEDSAICLLRRGAPAGGKNFLFDRTFALIPDDDIIRISSGSPLSLVYYGGEDEDAFKHKIIYVPEAAIIAEKNKVESTLTIMLRILISEGRLDHNVALPQADGPHEDEITDLVLDEAMKVMNGNEKQARSRLRSLISVALGKGT